METTAATRFSNFSTYPHVRLSTCPVRTDGAVSRRASPTLAGRYWGSRRAGTARLRRGRRHCRRTTSPRRPIHRTARKPTSERPQRPSCMANITIRSSPTAILLYRNTYNSSIRFCCHNFPTLKCTHSCIVRSKRLLFLLGKSRDF